MNSSQVYSCLIILIFVLILIIYYSKSSRIQNSRQNLEGFYYSPEDFNQSAHIDYVFAYIDVDKNNLNITSTLKFPSDSEEDAAYSGSLYLQISPLGEYMNLQDNYIVFKVKNLQDDLEILPNYTNLYYYIYENKLVWENKKNVYLVLKKNED